MEKTLVHALLFLGQILHSGSCSCYFSGEYQGVYLTQSIINHGGRVEYSRVDVLPTSIPVWGECYRKLGRNIILKQPVVNCYRCIRFSLRSVNILQVHSRGVDKCYTRESMAVESCPTEMEVHYSRIEDFILYRIQHVDGQTGPVPTYCPINGQYSFSYESAAVIPDPGESFTYPGTRYKPPSNSCLSDMSRLSNCPIGSMLNLEYRDCNFNSFDTSWSCLGSWSGNHGDSYITFLDSSSNARVKYRCGKFREVAGTGEIMIALSKDSTCSSELVSSSEGYERYSLKLQPTQAWPSMVTKTSCRFPEWTEGYWEDLYINGNTMVFKDKRNFKTYTSQCIQRSDKNVNRFLIYARSQCGEELYNCVWFSSRGSNVLEFQLGLRPSQSPSFQHCDNDHFLQRTWFTQGRGNPGEAVYCPLSGEYTGVLPDAPGLCAKMSSDCNNPDTMYYTVTNCNNQSNIYQGEEDSFTRSKKPYGQEDSARRFDEKYRQENILSRLPFPSGQMKAIKDDNHPNNNPYPRQQHSDEQEDLTTSDPDKEKPEYIASIRPIYKRSSYFPYRGKRSPVKYSPSLVYDPFNPWKKPWQRSTSASTTTPTTTPSTVGTTTSTKQWGRMTGSAFSENEKTTPEPRDSGWENIGYFSNYPDPSNNRQEPSGIYQQQSEKKRTYFPYHTAAREESKPDPAFHSNFYPENFQQKISTTTTTTELYKPPQRETEYEAVHYNNPEVERYPKFTMEEIVLDKYEIPAREEQDFFIDNELRIVAEPLVNLKVAEEREYQCLGQWEEEGLLYTYTLRRDIKGYECFVGRKDYQGKIILAEAGEDCRRGLKIDAFGMTLNKKSNCFGTMDPYTRPEEDSDQPADEPVEHVVDDHHQGEPWLPILAIFNNKIEDAKEEETYLKNEANTGTETIKVGSILDSYQDQGYSYSGNYFKNIKETNGRESRGSDATQKSHNKNLSNAIDESDFMNDNDKYLKRIVRSSDRILDTEEDENIPDFSKEIDSELHSELKEDEIIFETDSHGIEGSAVHEVDDVDKLDGSGLGNIEETSGYSNIENDSIHDSADDNSDEWSGDGVPKHGDEQCCHHSAAELEASGDQKQISVELNSIQTNEMTTAEHSKSLAGLEELAVGVREPKFGLFEENIPIEPVNLLLGNKNTRSSNEGIKDKDIDVEDFNNHGVVNVASMQKRTVTLETATDQSVTIITTTAQTISLPTEEPKHLQYVYNPKPRSNLTKLYFLTRKTTKRPIKKQNRKRLLYEQSYINEQELDSENFVQHILKRWDDESEPRSSAVQRSSPDLLRLVIILTLASRVKLL